MQEYQQRVVEEKVELDVKRDKLRAFLYADAYAELNDGERGELQAQYAIMGNYADILQSRIERFAG